LPDLPIDPLRRVLATLRQFVARQLGLADVGLVEQRVQPQPGEEEQPQAGERLVEPVEEQLRRLAQVRAGIHSAEAVAGGGDPRLAVLRPHAPGAAVFLAGGHVPRRHRRDALRRRFGRVRIEERPEQLEPVEDGRRLEPGLLPCAVAARRAVEPYPALHRRQRSGPVLAFEHPLVLRRFGIHPLDGQLGAVRARDRRGAGDVHDPSAARRIAAQASMRTTPAVPSTVIVAPSWIIWVATCVATTQGIAYSRAQIAECESTPPESVTTADAIAKSGVQGGAVVVQTRTSPGCRRLASARSLITRA